MRHRYLPLCILALAIGSGACGSDQLAVQGNVQLAIDGANTGFDFPQEINLAFDDVRSTVFSGHCTFTEEGVDVAIVRPSDSQADGLVRFSLFDRHQGAATLTAVAGDVEYRTDCEVRRLYADGHDGVYSSEFQCGLTATDGSQATATGELHFAGCIRR